VTPINDLHNWLQMPLQGYTDPFNNIQINANEYGDSNTPVDEFLTTEFLQTLAHELQHVQQGLLEKVLSHGELHDIIDSNATIMANSVVNEYLRRMKGGGNSASSCQCGR
jgi:hypothetical protein